MSERQGIEKQEHKGSSTVTSTKVLSRKKMHHTPESAEEATVTGRTERYRSIRIGPKWRQMRGVLSLEGHRPSLKTIPLGALCRQHCGRSYGKELQGPVRKPWCYEPGWGGWGRWGSGGWPLKIGVERWRPNQPISAQEALPRGIPSNEVGEPFPGSSGARWGGGEPGSVYKYL